MILYFDTSALVKLYTNENHAAMTRNAATKAQLITCHAITYVEARAALSRKHRDAELSVSEFARGKTKLQDDWQRFHVISVTESLINHAGDLAESHALRAYDSVHLAAAESVWKLAGEGVNFCFAVFDNQLLNAARERSIPVLM